MTFCVWLLSLSVIFRAQPRALPYTSVLHFFWGPNKNAIVWRYHISFVQLSVNVPSVYSHCLAVYSPCCCKHWCISFCTFIYFQSSWNDNSGFDILRCCQTVFSRVSAVRVWTCSRNLCQWPASDSILVFSSPTDLGRNCIKLQVLGGVEAGWLGFECVRLLTAHSHQLVQNQCLQFRRVWAWWQSSSFMISVCRVSPDLANTCCYSSPGVCAKLSVVLLCLP